MTENLRKLFSDFGGALALATSTGGHTELLEALAPAYADLPHFWVTAPGPQAQALRDRGADVLEVPNPQRNPRRLAANALAAAGALRARRPAAVLTAGANVAVAYCLAARAVGARAVFVETMARVDTPTLSGRVLSRVADHVLVQWPAMRDVYRGAEVCRPLLLEDLPAAPAEPGHGTFVAGGSHGQPFDRLVAWAEEAAAAGVLPGPVTVQASTRLAPSHVELVERLAPEHFHARLAAAAVVVTHGGAGVVSLALHAGRTPLVLPRRAALREHVDDHQVWMTEHLDRLGLVVSLDNRSAAEALAVRRPPAPEVVAGLEGEPLIPRVRAALEDVLGG